MMKKSMTTVNDLILIHLEDQPLAYARVEDIEPDVKKNWFRIKLLVLQIPPAVVTWILRDSYIDGEEYTMGGKRMRLEKVVVPELSERREERSSMPPETEKSNRDPEKSAEKSKVVSFADLKKSPRQ